jgi:hypothetical protein
MSGQTNHDATCADEDLGRHLDQQTSPCAWLCLGQPIAAATLLVIAMAFDTM